LLKRTGDILTEPLEGIYDLIYYDAFAPSKQSEMWTSEILRKVTSVLAPGGLLVTYCAKGQVKRDLAALGLTVETLPGPPGKKEMTRARRL
jgi:tRNA U34 5-methylaminomethyl-2-thiouridine-forming methyltransferase MnmC